MSRLEEIKEKHKECVKEGLWPDVASDYYEDHVGYLLNEVERYRSALKELSRYTNPDYPFKGDSLISEVHTLINLSLNES